MNKQQAAHVDVLQGKRWRINKQEAAHVDVLQENTKRKTYR